MADVAPSKWWQWAFLYPTLVLSLAGSIPTVVQEYKAWKLGVDSKRVQIISEQEKLWEKNLECLRLKPVYTITLLSGVEVGVTLCETGDALLRYQRDEDTVSYTWIRHPDSSAVTSNLHKSSSSDDAPISYVMYGDTRCVYRRATFIFWVHPLPGGKDCLLDFISLTRGRRLEQKTIVCLDYCEA